MPPIPTDGALRGGPSARTRSKCLTRLAGFILTAWTVASGPAGALADGPLRLKKDPYGSTTSREARLSALRSIPYDKLDPTAQAKVTSVVKNVSLFRRLPVRAVPCDPGLYVFLVEHPDVVVNIWRLMKVTKMEMEQTGPGLYRYVDHAGSEGTAEFIYSSPDTRLIYTECAYKGPLSAKPTQARGLLILRTGCVLEPDGRYYVTSRLDTFMAVEPGAVELLTKTLHPLFGKIADLNFVQTVGFFGSLSRTAEVNHTGMQRLAERLTEVQPEVRRRLAELSEQVAEKAAQLPDPPTPDGPLVVQRPDEGDTQ